ncbi:hypothetical protein SERLA73DRAFT_43522, partial [Serpula lacrymans var. lacrymans S7.3]
VYEHLTNVNRILQRLGHAGATVPAKKFTLCTPTVSVVGHWCTYEGQRPDPARVKVIQDWPICQTVMDVHSFLGTTGVVCIFIKDYTFHMCPLVDLIPKGVTFYFGPEHVQAMLWISSRML